jgi:hypothetical protein
MYMFIKNNVHLRFYVWTRAADETSRFCWNLEPTYRYDNVTYDDTPISYSVYDE